MSFAPVRLELCGVHKSYGSVRALAGVDLRVEPGEFVALVGPGGAGKTTLLRLAAGLERPDRGEVRAGGVPVAGPHPSRGLIFQDAALFPWMTVLDNVLFGPLSRGVPRAEAEAAALHWLRYLGLDGFRRAYPSQLSGGMQKRAAIARAVVGDPAVLLCDEPFAGLDWITRQRVLDEFLRLWHDRRMTVIYVTHALEEAVYAAQRVVLLTAGPGQVAAQIPVDLPDRRWERPDLRYSPSFARQVAALRAAFREQAVRGRAPGMSRAADAGTAREVATR